MIGEREVVASETLVDGDRVSLQFPARGDLVVLARLVASAIATRVGGPQLGALHPVADAVGVVLFEVTGAVLAPARRRGP